MDSRGPAASRSPLRGLLASLTVLCASATAAYVMLVIARHTIDVVRARHLLPRWDLATHLGHGWLDYYLLITGHVHRFFWDLWQQGYWPPGLSIYQVPFYLALGGEMTSGLWSSAAAFVVVAAIGAVILVRQDPHGGVLGAAVFVSLLVSSPYLLAYATVTMTEMLGAAVQLVVIVCYQAWREHPAERQARFLALSLTALFFVKYNYFILLVAPLVLYEFLDRTSGWTVRRRLDRLWRFVRRMASSPTAMLLAAYLVGVLLIVSTGGFEFRLFGQRVSVRSIGNSGYLVLYGLLLRVWYLHRRGRIDWHRLAAADTRVRPLLLWFVLPVTIWLASPYPNHIRDFANLVINRPFGPPTVRTGTLAYLDVLRNAYFFDEWTLAVVVAAFAVAAMRYRLQPPTMQWLILAVPLQFAAIGIHQTRFPRFLLLTVVLLCLTSAAEVGRWFVGTMVRRATAGLMAAIVLVAGVSAARRLVTDERFTAAAFEHYTDSGALRAALGAVRAELDAGDRLLIVGQSDELSPALFRWELGPPSGVPCFPFEIAGAARLDPARATHVLLLLPAESGSVPLNSGHYNPDRVRAIFADIDRGSLVLRHAFPVPDIGATLSLFARRSAPEAPVPCAP